MDPSTQRASINAFGKTANCGKVNPPLQLVPPFYAVSLAEREHSIRENGGLGYSCHRSAMIDCPKLRVTIVRFRHFEGVEQTTLDVISLKNEVSIEHDGCGNSD